MSGAAKEKKSEEAALRYGGRIVSGKALACAEIQQVLFAYLARELSESQAVLVREHIRKCAVCRAEAAEIEQTVNLLRQTDGGGMEVRLSDERRKRIMLAVFHPVLNWIYVHHRLVSILLALLVLLAVVLGLRDFAIFRHPRLNDAIPVWIKPGPPPEPAVLNDFLP